MSTPRFPSFLSSSSLRSSIGAISALLLATSGPVSATVTSSAAAAAVSGITATAASTVASVVTSAPASASTFAPVEGFGGGWGWGGSAGSDPRPDEAIRRGYRIADGIATETLEVAVAIHKYVNEYGRIPQNQQTLIAASFQQEIQRAPPYLGGALIEINSLGQVVTPVTGQYVEELCQYVSRRDPEVIGMYRSIPHECKRENNRTLVIMGNPLKVGRTPIKLPMPEEPLGINGVQATPPSMTFLPGEATTLNYFQAGHEHRMAVMWTMPPYQRAAETIIRCQKLSISPEVLRQRARNLITLAVQAAIADENIRLKKPDAAYIYTLTHSAFFLRSVQSNLISSKDCDLKEVPNWKEAFTSATPKPPVLGNFGTMTPSHALGLWNLCLKLNSMVDDPHNTLAVDQARVAVASCRKQYRDFVRIESAARKVPIPVGAALEKEVAAQEKGEIVLEMSRQAILDARALSGAGSEAPR